MGETLFSGLSFLTDPGRVFMPRPATRRLVERALELGPRRLADVGTGSGAIAVAIAVRATEAEVWATDTSEAAVRLAYANAVRQGVAGRVHVVHADLLAGAPRDLDLVVANLPYLPDAVRLEEYDDEPPEAVYAPGDGLVHYHRLLRAAEARLRPGGRLLIQFRAKLLEARRHELHGLRERLESSAWVAS